MFFPNEYITLQSLKVRTGLPEKYLVKLAENGDIPSLLVNGKRRFKEDDVLTALKELANKPVRTHRPLPGGRNVKTD